MKRLAALILVMALAVGGCVTLADMEKAGTTDKYLNYCEQFLYGAQLALPLFGAYGASAKIVIEGAQSLIPILRKSSDDLAAQAKLKADMNSRLSILQDLGNMAQIGSPSNPR